MSQPIASNDHMMRLDPETQRKVYEILLRAAVDLVALGFTAPGIAGLLLGSTVADLRALGGSREEIEEALRQAVDLVFSMPAKTPYGGAS